MKRSSLNMQKIKAIFISHEHSDHIRGISTIVKKHKLPVFITTDTLRNGRLEIEKDLVRSFAAYEPVMIGDLAITAFPKFHDAADPYSFTIACKGVKVGVFTDIGKTCDHVVRNFRQCHAAFLEANYDEEMLQNGNYPYHLKNRIRGGRGHLSNREALELFLNQRPDFMSHLFLSHLSQNNNCPKLVERLFTSHAGATKVVVASRYEETPVYHIYEGEIEKFDLKPKTTTVSQLQFSYF